MQRISDVCGGKQHSHVMTDQTKNRITRRSTRYKQVLHGKSRSDIQSEKRRDQSKIDSRPQNYNTKKIAKNVPEMQGNAREGDLVERDFSPHTLPHMRQKSVGSPPSTRAFPRSICPGISRDISHFRVFCSVSSLSPCTSKRRTFCTRKRLFLAPRIRVLHPLPHHNLSPLSHHIFSQKHDLRPHIHMHFPPPHRNPRRNCPQRPPFRKMRVRSRSGHHRDTIETVSRNFLVNLRQETPSSNEYPPYTCGG